MGSFKLTGNSPGYNWTAHTLGSEAGYPSSTMSKTYFIALEATRRHEQLKPPHTYNPVVTPCPAPGWGAGGEEWVDGGEGAFQFYSARDFFPGKERIKPRIMVCFFYYFLSCWW